MRCLCLVSCLLTFVAAIEGDLQIDWDFISEQEGGQQLKAYVPNPSTSKSGVTVATGFDLGQRKLADLQGLGLDAALVDKLKPYLGLKSQEAKTYLDAHPLTIIKAEADAIDKASKAASIAALTKSYDAAVAGDPKLKKFAELPTEAQTVVASVAFQYGDLSKRTPKFWKFVIAQDWKSSVRELWHFGDDYETRRFTEGDRLAALVADLPRIKESVGAKGANKADDVKIIQMLLTEKKAYSGAISGTADEATITAIRGFQKSIMLPAPDGLVSPGKKTWRRLAAF